MPTFTGTSVKGLSFVGQSAVNENVLVVYDTRAISSQVYQRKGTVLAYARPSWIPADLPSIHVANGALYYGGTWMRIPVISPGIPFLILMNWHVDGIPYRIDTGSIA